MSKTLEELEKENAALLKQVQTFKDLDAQQKKYGTTVSQTSVNTKKYIGDMTIGFDEFKGKITEVGKEFGNAFNPLNVQPFIELDEAATKIQKTFGLTKSRFSEFKDTLADVTPRLMKIGMTEDEVVTNTINLMKSMGTSASLGEEAIVELSAAAKVSGKDAGVLAEKFREVGVSVYDAGDRMKEVTDYARNVGVSVTAVSEKVVANLNKMNLYNFDNGVTGLAKMAAQSERLGIKMETVFNFAEKVFNPEGAIEMAAGLQRLGVTASGLLDPLRAMDMAANDPEALQKEIINVTKEFTKFNEASGKFEIMPGSKRRLREIAKEMNIPAEELAEMSIKAADFDMKMKQIEFPSLATDQETKEMIAGMAQMKDGKAVINVKNEQTGEVKLKSVDQLTGEDLESLKKAQEDGSKSIEQIALDQLSISESIEKNTAAAVKSVGYGRVTAEPLEKLYGQIFGAQQVITKNLANTVTTQAARREGEGLTKPMEDYIVSGIKGDQAGMADAEKRFIGYVTDAEQRLKSGSQEFVDKTISEISNNLKDAYLQPQKVETTATVNLNMSITGDANVKNMDLNSIQDKIVSYLTQSPEGRSLLKEAVENKNTPMAMTGSKNQ
jgi:hypothetical protein